MCLQCFDRNQKALFARQVGCNNQTHAAVVKHCPQQRREGVPPESTHVDAGDDMLGLEFKSGPAFVIHPLGNEPMRWRSPGMSNGLVFIVAVGVGVLFSRAMWMRPSGVVMRCVKLNGGRDVN